MLAQEHVLYPLALRLAAGGSRRTAGAGGLRCQSGAGALAPAPSRRPIECGSAILPTGAHSMADTEIHPTRPATLTEEAFLAGPA